MHPKQSKQSRTGKHEYKKSVNTKINELVTDKKITYIEAVLEICHETGMSDIEVSIVIDISVKAHIHIEAEEINLIAKTGRLPL